MTIVLKKDDDKERDFTEEWNSIANKIQFFNKNIIERLFPQHKQISQIFSGKLGAPASFANLMAKYKGGEDGDTFSLEGTILSKIKLRSQVWTVFWRV